MVTKPCDKCFGDGYICGSGSAHPNNWDKCKICSGTGRVRDIAFEKTQDDHVNFLQAELTQRTEAISDPGLKALLDDAALTMGYLKMAVVRANAENTAMKHKIEQARKVLA